MMWRPHTEMPLFRRPTSVLVAFRDEDGFCLAGLYCSHRGKLVGESSDEAPPMPYWWVTEDDVLQPLEGGV